MSYFRQFLNSTFSRNQVLFLFSLIFADLAILYLARSTIGIHALFFLLTIPVMGAGWLFGPYAGGISGFLTALTGALLAISWKLTTWERALTAWPLMFLFILIGYTVGLIKLQRQQRQTLTNYLGRCKKLADLLSTLGPKWLETTVAEERYSYLTEQLRDFLGAKSVHLLTSDKQGTIQVLASSGSMNPPPSLLAKQILITNDIFEQFPSNNHMVILAPEMPAKMVPLSDLEDVEVPAEGELVVPLLMAGSLLGVLVIHFEQSLPLAQEHKIGIQWTGWQALLLLWGSQQEKHFLKQLQQSQALARIAQTLNLTETVGLEPLLQLVVDSAHQLIPNSQNVVLHLIEQDRHILIPKAVSDERKLAKTRLNMQLGKGIAGRAISEGKTIYVPDIRNEQHFIPPSTSVTYRSLLVVPIKKSNREVIGTLSVESDLPFAFTAEDISLLETLSFHAAIAIENTRLLETTRQDLQELSALYQISRMLASTLNPQELFYETVHLLNQLFGFYHTQIFLVDHTRRALVICAASGEHAKALLEQEYAIEFGSGIVGHVAEIGEAFFTNDVDAVIFHVRHPLLEETQSELAIPIKVNNQVWGVLDIQEKPPRQIHKHQMDLLHAVADQLSVALEKAQLYQDLQNALRQERETRMQLLQSERLALAGRLLASISHELNNPIQAIQNALFLLRQEEKLSPQGKQDLDIVLSETQRMASLLSRLRSSYRPLHIEDFRPTNLNDLIEDVYALTSTFLRYRNIIFVFHPDPNLPLVPVVPDQMHQVFLNLIMNAVDAMMNGGTLTITTALQADEKRVLVTVSDTGRGLNPKIQDRIFEPFVTDKESGSGLGLTICAEIIQKHRGNIKAENAPTGGAIFTISLPVHQEQVS